MIGPLIFFFLTLGIKNNGNNERCNRKSVCDVEFLYMILIVLCWILRIEVGKRYAG